MRRLKSVLHDLLALAVASLLLASAEQAAELRVGSAGIVVTANEQEAAAGLIAFLASPAAQEAVTKSGLEPMIAGTAR